MARSINPPIVSWVKNWVYVVQPNDSLSSITAKLSGNANRYYELVGANPQKEKMYAPPGFKYHFFKELYQGEKLKVPGNWRSKEASFGIGFGGIDFGKIQQDILNQAGGFGKILGTWYNDPSRNLPAYNLPSGLQQEAINKIADLIIAWTPSMSNPLGGLNPLKVILILVGEPTDPSYAQLLDLFNQAATLVTKITPAKVPSLDILTAIPWDTIPWKDISNWLPAFNNALPNGGFYDWLSTISPQPVYTMSGGKYIVDEDQYNVNQSQGIWNPKDVSTIDPNILNQIPWDKIGAIDWTAVTAAIGTYGTPKAEDIQKTKACWDKCVIDINQATVDDFFKDAMQDPKHGCCRWKCETEPDCKTKVELTCLPGVMYQGKCVVNCPSGTELGADNTCEPIIVPSATECDSSHPCAIGYDCVNNKCHKHGEPLPLQTGYHCPTGSNWDSNTGHCKDSKGNIVQAVKDEAAPVPPAKDNTVLYVIAGLVGVLIIGGTIIAVSGKEKTEKPSEKLASSSASERRRYVRY